MTKKETSLEELGVIRNETLGGMHAFYDSLEGDQDPVGTVARMQGKIKDLIHYIIALEAYINALPSTPKNLGCDKQ